MIRFTELIAVISQDARHVEVRDALPSPLGLIVVPAEAANRIVKQQPDGASGRVTSRNSLSLTSFLASFLSGSPAAASERDDLGGATTPPVQGGIEEFRSLAADGQLNEFPSAGGAAPLSAFALPDNIYQRSIPAVNIVFLVDTLRVCRFVDTYPAHDKKNDDEQVHVRDQRLLGLADAAGVVEEPFFDSLGDLHKSETSVLHQAAVFGDDFVSCAKDGSVPESRNDNLCTCGTASKHYGGCDVPGLHSQFSDVTLLCAGGCEIPSHRALLAARCSFFEAKLTRPHWEAQGPDKVSQRFSNTIFCSIRILLPVFRDVVFKEVHLESVQGDTFGIWNCTNVAACVWALPPVQYTSVAFAPFAGCD